MHSKAVGLAHLGEGITKLIYHLQDIHHGRRRLGWWREPCRAVRHTKWPFQCNRHYDGRRTTNLSHGTELGPLFLPSINQLSERMIMLLIR